MKIDFLQRKRTSLVFLHIPKTAGTSLMHFLESNYKPKQILRHYADIDLEEDKLKQDYKLIAGHIPFNHLMVDIEKAQAVGWRFISFLRNPIDRAVSQFLATKYSSDSAHQHKMKLWDHSFEGFLASPHSFNWQCQFFSGMKLQSEVLENPELLLDLAIKNAKRLDFIGFTEQYEHSLEKMMQLFHLKPFEGASAVNISAYKSEKEALKKAHIEVLESRSQLDFRLIEILRAD